LWAALLLVLGLLAVGVAGGLIARDLQQETRSDIRLRQTTRFQLDQQALRIAMLNEKSDLNLYIHNPTPAYAEGVDNDVRAVWRVVTSLEQNAPSPELSDQLVNVRAAIATYQDFAAKTKAPVDQTGQATTSTTASLEGSAVFAGFTNADLVMAAQAQKQLDSSIDEVAALDSHKQRVLVISGLLLAAIVVILAVLLLWRVLRPVERLAAVARELGEGKESPIPMKGRRDEVGELARALASWQRAAEERRQSEELALRLGRIMDGSTNEIYVVGDGLRIVEANQTAARHLGYSLHELQSMRIPDIAPGLAPEDADARARALSSNEVDEIVFDSIHRRKDGVEYPVEVRLQRAQGAQDPLFIAVIQDISERRQVEEARRESEAKSRFLAAMSHELRTPLNSILGFAQLLAMRSGGQLSEKQQRYVSNIESSGAHLLGLINDVLDLAKVASGRLVIRPELLEVADTVEDALAKVRPLADAKGQTLTIKAEPGLRVWADRLRFHQVVLNLLSNAIKFTPERGSVTVEAKRRGRLATISVSDTGIGIPADQLESIFEEFVQVDSGLDRQQNGTGLGLALTKKLAELMSGTVSVESELGKGSQFTVTLRQRPPKRPARKSSRPEAATVLAAS
jgi:PAS domain S-box-containing protein